MTWSRLLVLIFVMAIGGSLLGSSQLAGSLVLIVGLVGLMAVVITGGRSRRGGSGRGTRTLSGLGLIKAPPADSLPTLLLAGLAGAAAAEGFGVPFPSAVIAAVVCGVLVGCFPKVAGPALAVAGTLGALYGTYGSSSCRAAAASSSSTAVLLLVLVAGIVIFLVVRLSPFGLIRPLRRKRNPGKLALLCFGLVDLALFIAFPLGLTIWDGAPWWAGWVAAICLLVIFGAAGYAPELVLALVSLAVLGATVALAAYETGALAGEATPCSNAVPALVLTAILLVVAGMATRVSGAWDDD